MALGLLGWLVLAGIGAGQASSAEVETATAPDVDGSSAACAYDCIEQDELDWSMRPTAKQSGRWKARVQDPAASDSELQLAFENAPIEHVVSALIGDALQAEFVIDPAVTGRITLRSASAISGSDIPLALDRALRLAGATLVETAPRQYLIVPINRANEFRRGPRLAGQALTPGFGSVVVPLEFVSASDMARILRPFVPTGSPVQVEEDRQLLILTGNPNQLDVMLETVALFDVDWLAQMSFAVHPLTAAEPETLIGEVARIFGGADGPIGAQVEFVPLERLNAVVIIAHTRERLEQARAWLERLDVRADRGRRVRVMPLVSADAQRMADRLNELFAADLVVGDAVPITVQADPDSNTLLIIADEAGFDQVREVVTQLDQAPDQVMIEVRIVEVVLNDDLRLGVQWFLDTRDGGQATSTGNAGGGVAASFPGFAYTYSSDYVRAALNAIASVTDVETISTPQIMALNNQASLIQVGDQVPVVTQSAVSIANPDAPIVNSVEFRDTGVVLNVTPRIGPDGSVMMAIQQEVSSVAETTTSGIDSPTIQQRRFETSVIVQDGQSVALGGLIRTSRSQTRSGVPGLQRVPLLGRLFRETSDTSRRTELIVFLTPHVVRSTEDAAAATLALRNRLETLRERGFGHD